MGLEEHSVDGFDPMTLCKEVKQMNKSLLALAGSVKSAMLRFEHVDSQLEQLQNVQTVLDAKMERVLDNTVQGNSEPKSVPQTTPSVAPPVAPAARVVTRSVSATTKNKRKKTKNASVVLQNDIMDIDFDLGGGLDDGKNTSGVGSGSNLYTPTYSGKNPSNYTVTQWLTKSLRSVTSVEV